MRVQVDCPHPGGTHKVACRVTGRDAGPAVLCAHGLSRNARDFDAVADRLAGEFRVVCVDMPGRGESDWLDDPALYSQVTILPTCAA